MSSRSLKAAAASNNDVLTIDQLRHQDDWVLDTERYRCHVCTRNFTRFRRKHHCRKVRFCIAFLLSVGFVGFIGVSNVFNLSSVSVDGYSAVRSCAATVP